MENYFIERETLAEFVDSLIAKKTQPIENPETTREEAIKKLDDRISQAIFGGLTKKQLDEINTLLDQEDADDQAFQDFFNRAGVNLEEVIKKAMQDFGQEFLGGENV
ncbi:hypothetical protein IKF94_03615 [Candidatus Saccharibacteria bacterium]|nr:hypothetical protein [Candidatus Saccharibacteria bacterium]